MSTGSNSSSSSEIRALSLIAVASSEATRAALYEQLSKLEYVDFDGVMLELSDAVKKCMESAPDVIVIDLTGRELDGGMFIEAMSMNPDNPCVIFALHQELDHQIILDAVKRGAKEFIQYPEDKNSLSAALKRHCLILNRARVNHQEAKATVENANCKLITVFGAKGGAGSTTVAVNLAHELHAIAHDSTVLVDLDQVFNNTAVMLNLKPTVSLGDLANNKANEVDDQLLSRAVIHHDSGLHIMVGTKSVLDDNPMIGPDLLQRIIEYLTSHYRYVVVDLPTHVLDPYHQYLVEHSQEVLVVAQMDIPSLYRTRQYLELAKTHLENNKIKLILNRFNLKAAYGMSNQSLEEEFQYPVFGRLANDWELNVEANSLGKVLGDIRPKSDLVKNIRTIAAQLADLEGGFERPVEIKDGFFSKLFGQGTSKTKEKKPA